MTTDPRALIAEGRKHDEAMTDGSWSDWPGTQGLPSFPRVLTGDKPGGREEIAKIGSWTRQRENAIGIAWLRTNLAKLLDLAELGILANERDHRPFAPGQRDLVIEVCHDLINRAMRNESDPIPSPQYAASDRAKEAAIRALLDGYASALDELADLRNRVADVQREAGMQALVIEQQDRDMERLKKFEAAVAQGFLDLGAANQQINRLTSDLTAARDMNRHYEQERDAWPAAYKQRAQQTDARIAELEAEAASIRGALPAVAKQLSDACLDCGCAGFVRDAIDDILNPTGAP